MEITCEESRELEWKWEQEAFEKCWAHSPLRAAARRLFYIAIHQVSLLSHAACASMSTTTSTTTTTTTRDRRDRYMAPLNGPNELMGIGGNGNVASHSGTSLISMFILLPSSYHVQFNARELIYTDSRRWTRTLLHFNRPSCSIRHTENKNVKIRAFFTPKIKYVSYIRNNCEFRWF